MMDTTTDTPRLSPTVARDLLECPARAYKYHRLLGGESRKTTDAMERGLVLERLITGYDVERIVIIEASDYRKKEAREQRDAARAAGKIPLLTHHHESVSATASILAGKINDRVAGWANGKDQVRAEWEADGCFCSGVMDRLWLDHTDNSATIYELKTCANAAPKRLERDLLKFGYDVQAAAYLDAVETLHPEFAGRTDVVLVFCETDSLACVTPAVLDGAYRMRGKALWERAKRVWRRCLENDDWPEYVPTNEYAMLECRPYDLEDVTDENEKENEEWPEALQS